MDEDKVSITSAMLMSLITKALGDKKNLTDMTSAQAVKVAFTEGIKHRSERQSHPLHRYGIWRLFVMFRTLLQQAVNID